MAEYCSSGIWVVGTRGVWRHGMVKHATLGLPSELAVRFCRWIEQYTQQLEGAKLDVTAFNEEGRCLANALKAAMPPGTAVEFVPEKPDGGLGQAENI
jgi:hypothetical protein